VKKEHNKKRYVLKHKMSGSQCWHAFFWSWRDRKFGCTPKKCLGSEKCFGRSELRTLYTCNFWLKLLANPQTLGFNGQSILSEDLWLKKLPIFLRISVTCEKILLFHNGCLPIEQSIFCVSNKLEFWGCDDVSGSTTMCYEQRAFHSKASAESSISDLENDIPSLECQLTIR